MADPGTIRQIADRNMQMLALKPGRGRLTGRTRARLVDGLRCEIEEGAWRIAADMHAKAGGDETTGLAVANPALLAVRMPAWPTV